MLSSSNVHALFVVGFFLMGTFRMKWRKTFSDYFLARHDLGNA